MSRRVKPRSNLCKWDCGRPTDNHSGICDECWSKSELLRSNSDEGYKAWLERKRAQSKRSISDKQRAALTAARRAKFSVDLLAKGPKTASPGVARDDHGR
jgi:hypothetical protein